MNEVQEIDHIRGNTLIKSQLPWSLEISPNYGMPGWRVKDYILVSHFSWGKNICSVTVVVKVSTAIFYSLLQRLLAVGSFEANEEEEVCHSQMYQNF